MLLPLLLLALLLAGSGQAAARIPPTGRNDVSVVTTDIVPAAGTFHYVATDTAAAPRFVFASDAVRHVVRRKDVSTGIWQTIAGEDGKAGSRDGPIGTSLLNRPTAMCTTPLSDLVVVDSAGACVRLVTQDGMVSTLAGVCGSTGQRDGTGQSALFSDSIQSITCLANCSVLVADQANGRLRILNLHDPDCYAAAKKALARRYTARSLWAVGLVVALVAALAAAVVIHSRQLTAAGFVVWRRSGEQGGATADSEYGPLVDAAEVPDTPPLPRAEE
ncbi:NHL domain-containing [Chlorella sorokiniana]|uniref:NHL domain-containing n=1 Tax=Chlorella sorokiniana TaxID=3076 RepID=A0A2P6TDZ9_CHLSO|nr:NHL domain-containing [Chlorella sorokiniana]|eukprot:PRW20852.1 NHL domain-containing [Chlorella sorokiniana]